MKHHYTNTAFIFVSVIALLCFSSCGNSKTKTSEETESKTDTTQREERIAILTPEQMKAVGIELGVIEQQNLSSVVKAIGTLTVPPQNRAVVNALVGGVIRGINVVEGQQIRKGQVVVTIENPDFIRLQQDYLTSKDNIVYLAQEFERQRILKEADAGIGKVYEQASANYAAGQSKLRTLEAQLRQIHINPSQVRRGALITQVPVLAPIGGTAGRINLSVGTYTDASTPIMEIVNNSAIYSDLQVFEKDIGKVRVGQKVAFILTSQPNKQVSGQVYGINKSFDTESNTVSVHAIINNIAPLNLLAGQYVTALIQTGTRSVPAISKDAIVKMNDKSYIFILEGMEKEPVKKGDDDNEANTNLIQDKYRFEMVEVITGVEELGYVELKIIKELQLNTKIVTKGAFYIYSSMQSIETDDL